MIGTLGAVVFEVSADKVQTFDDFKRSGSGRWDTHDLWGRKPALEFKGPGLEQIGFSIHLDFSLGINPGEQLNLLRKMRDRGMAVPFILNGKPLTEHLWVVESVSEAWTQIDNKGSLLAADVELTLFEYVKPLGGRCYLWSMM